MAARTALQLNPLLHHILDTMPTSSPVVDLPSCLDRLAPDRHPPGTAQRGTVDECGSLAAQEWREDDHRSNVFSLNEAKDVPSRVDGNRLDFAVAVRRK